MPIALMMRESYHPSFGKPDDGLGFQPEMCDHMYGSTAIAGLCDYVAEQFPPEYRNRMFVGNVVTNRINAAQLTPRGSGFHADDSPDFVVTDDQWFRPVCIKLGPDGALYVSDFYNRIIGHYEVDLHHPGRDKQRGRIWRIVYRGQGQAAGAPKFDLTKQDVSGLVDDMASPNLTIRMLAMNRLADTIGKPAIEPVKQMLAATKDPFQKVHGLWVLYRLAALDPAMLKAAATDADPVVREHAMRIIGEIPAWEEGQRDLALVGLKDANPLVRRVGAEALARHPQVENVRPLLDVREQKGNDPDLTYGLRIALRDQLQHEGVCPQLTNQTLSEEDQRDLADVVVGTTGPEAAGFLLRYVRTATLSQKSLATYLRTIVRAVPQDQADELAKFMQSKFADDIDLQLTSFKSVIDGLGQRGARPGDAVRAWGEALAGKVLSDASVDRAHAWSFHPLAKSKNSQSPWGIQMRKSADGDSESAFLSSNVRGETLTGVARSPNFTIPAKLTFFLAGHNGPPPAKNPIKNIVRLCDAKSDEVLARQAPPRNDVAQQVTWDLSAFAGRQGYVEATDGDTGKAYAWLALGRFDPPVIPINASGVRVMTAVQIAQSLQLTTLAGAIEQVLGDEGADAETRVAAAGALGSMDPASHVTVLSGALREPSAPDVVRDAAANALGAANSKESSAALVLTMTTAPERMQLALAKALAAGPQGAEALLEAIRSGKASARLLQDQNVRERLAVAKPANLDARIAELTKGLPAADAQIQKLIDSRAAAFDAAQASPERGRAVFEKTCMVCHMVGGKGAHVGPQLDGIGVRGVPRLCEDILDPSRNVDVAFRYSTFVLADGNVIAGIPRKEEGQTLTVADSTGKDVAIDKSKITRRVESKLSLMPSNFGEIIPAADFNDLLSYLLSTTKP
jgi:putative heme-binding domain-containing protein